MTDELNCSYGSNIGQHNRTQLECNFLSSHDYMKTAVSLLPSDSWASHYELSLKCYYYLAKAAYPCGFIDESKDILSLIIEKAKDVNHKLDAYTLLVSIQATNDPPKAFQTCIEVLGILGEKVAENDIDQAEAMAVFQQVKAKFMIIPDGQSFQMEDDSRDKERIMFFFTQLATLAFIIKPALCIAYISKYTDFAFEYKIKSKHTPSAIVHFASVLCSSLGPDTELGCKIGKIGMSLLKQYYSSSDEAPATILGYYGQVGVLNERLQECEFMHARGREIAQANGNLYMASLNLIAQISRALQGGTHLVALQREIEVELKKAQNVEKEIATQLNNVRSSAIDTPALLLFQQLVHALINGDSGQSEAQSQSETMLLDIHHQGKMMLNILFGDAKEALHHASKIQTRSLLGILLRAFYSGLSSISLYRLNGSGELLEDVRASMQKLEHASKCSEYNFSNKFCLVAAELLSVEGSNDAATSKYEAAVNAAHSSKFIHEEVS